MRDGLSRPSSLRNPTGTSTPSGDVSVDRWRARLRATALRDLVDATKELVWTHELLMALLEELHVTEEFDRLIGRTRLDVVRDAPRLLALALFLRHSWDPDDLSAAVDRVLCPPCGTATHSSPTTRGDRGHRHRRRLRTRPSGPRARKELP
ncbi:MAG: hypothetical protein AB7N65_09140 [Vicinamibacterales bacterium]